MIQRRTEIGQMDRNKSEPYVIIITDDAMRNGGGIFLTSTRIRYPPFFYARVSFGARRAVALT